MKTIYERPRVFTDAITTYCGGCGHGIVNKLIAELIDEMGLQRNGIIVWPIGCSCLADKFFDMDQIMALHGRAPATATGIKRAEPDKFVLVYQGDGDMVSEGMAEIMHAAIRGEKFSVIFINNAIYGMTGGQVAPTTLMGQKATTAPMGREAVTPVITRETDYAIRLLRTLADGERHTAAEAAERELVPQPFAYKILKKLSKAGLVEVTRGADGGCRLLADLEKTSLYDLMEAMGESCRLSGCTVPGHRCTWREAHGGCTVHCHLAAIQAKLNAELKAHTLAEILRESG